MLLVILFSKMVIIQQLLVALKIILDNFYFHIGVMVTLVLDNLQILIQNMELLKYIQLSQITYREQQNFMLIT